MVLQLRTDRLNKSMRIGDIMLVGHVTAGDSVPYAAPEEHQGSSQRLQGAIDLLTASERRGACSGGPTGLRNIREVAGPIERGRKLQHVVQFGVNSGEVRLSQVLVGDRSRHTRLANYSSWLLPAACGVAPSRVSISGVRDALEEARADERARQVQEGDG